jgi:hypothetical protein
MSSGALRTWVFWASVILGPAGPAWAQPLALGPVGQPHPVVPEPAVNPLSPPPPTADVPFEASPPIALPEVASPDHWRIFAEGDYLYLRPRRQLQDYAIVDPFSDTRVAGSIEHLNWDWRSAFRVGGGIGLDSGFEAAFYYTYLHDATQGGVTAPNGGILFATLTHPGTVDQVASAFAATSFNYNVFDFDLAHTFVPTPSFALRLFVSSRSARIDQNFNVFYDGVTAIKDFVSTRVNFDGTGARVGAEGTWHPGCGLGLYGRAAASLVLGEFKTHLAEVNNAGTTVLVDVTDRFEKVLPVLELGFGLTYEIRGLRLMAGYEFTNWFGLANLPDFADDFHQGKFVRRISDLSIDGLAVRAEWRY